MWASGLNLLIMDERTNVKILTECVGHAMAYILWIFVKLDEASDAC